MREKGTKRSFLRNSRSGSLRMHLVSALVWSSVLICVVALFQRRSESFEILGVAQGQVLEISSASTGWLKSVQVKLFEEFRKGQTLAIVDKLLEREYLQAELHAQVAVAEAEIKRLQGELNATQDQLVADVDERQTDLFEQQRRLAVDVQQARLEVLELQTTLQPDRIMLENLELDIKILLAQHVSAQQSQQGQQMTQSQQAQQSLQTQQAQRSPQGQVQQGQQQVQQTQGGQQQVQQTQQGQQQVPQQVPQVQPIPQEYYTLPYEREKLVVQKRTLAKKIEETEHLLGQAEQDLVRAQNRYDELAQHHVLNPSVESALSPIRGEITVQKKTIEGLLALMEQAPMELIAPFDGRVSQILRRNGEVVLSGDPILTIAEESSPREIVAWADETMTNELHENMKVKIIKRTRPFQIVDSQVVSLGPAVELMPEQLWIDQNTPRWGRPILIAVHPDMKLLPGEIVGIRGL